MGRKEDQFIRESLKEGTDPSVDRKEDIWLSMQEKLDEIDQNKEITHKDVNNENMKNSNIQLERETRKMRKNNTNKRKKWTMITAAAILIFSIMLSSTTEQGQAFISQIRMLFEPEKTIEQELEGMPEDTDMNLHEEESISEQEADFVIYVDEERYEVVKEDGVFRITVDLPERYPEVYMDITQLEDVKPEEAIEEIKQVLSKEYPNVREMEQVESPVIGHRISANNGNEWDSEVVVYYVVSNELEGSFIIKQKYFLEASEGHGARMYNMLKEFYVITAENDQPE